jgi:hypothetical protein
MEFDDSLDVIRPFDVKTAQANLIVIQQRLHGPA